MISCFLGQYPKRSKASNLAESSSDATAETELNPPTVQEYADFVEGDRETTMTFVNHPKTSTLTIYKHEKGNYPVFLPGARFKIRYADPNVSAQVWTLTTGADGMIHINLPYAGTLIIEKLEAPAGYVIGQTSMWEVTVAKGEDKRIDISNDKKANIIVYKKDAQTGQLLAGAIIKATLLRAHTAPYNQNVSYTETTNAAGEAVFSNMIPGEYRIEEQSPPQYYLGTTVVHTVSVFDGSNEPVTVTFENEPWTGLTIRKVDATNGQGLRGAVFKLYGGTAADPSAFLGDFVSNENGTVTIQNLESNKYYTIFEAQAPFGYFVDDEHNVQTILIKPDAIDQLYKSDNCKSRSEFIEKAIKFYCGYVSAGNALDFLPESITSAVSGAVQSSENRMARLMFKLAVETSMMMNVVAANADLDDVGLKRLRGKCVDDVKKSIGAINFDEVLRYQRGES